MVTDRELVEKWQRQVFRSVESEVERLLAGFPDRRQLPIPFSQCGTDYRFSAPLLSEPDRTLEAGQQALAEFAATEFDERVDADERIYLRVTDVPQRIRYPLTGINADHLNRLVAVDATVTACEDPRPRIVTGEFRCRRCGETHAVSQRRRRVHRPAHCPSCRAAGTLTLAPDRSSYVDSQVVHVSDGERTLPVTLEHDLAGSVDPGEDLGVVAIPRGRFDGETTTVDVELEAVSIDHE